MWLRSWVCNTKVGLDVSAKNDGPPHLRHVQGIGRCLWRSSGYNTCCAVACTVQRYCVQGIQGGRAIVSLRWNESMLEMFVVHASVQRIKWRIVISANKHEKVVSMW